MNLTNQQITQINEILVLNGLDYEDLKLEVTDHIASEIEVLMEENTLSFEDNLKTIFEKWKPELQPSFSGLVGFTNPRIMTNKCHKLLRKQLLNFISISFLMAIISVLFFRNSNNTSLLINIQAVLKPFILIELCLVLSALFFVWKSRHQTTYSYLMKKKSINLIIFLFLLGIGVFPVRLNHADIKIAFISIFFAISYTVYTGIYLQLAYKHFQFEKKLSISNS
ncbi:hypothetical protein J3S90_05265 [Flavobacterium sp. P4023]|uniref:DUF1129 domain-containing protein n=1 Tax=Flavobacterium flabelliforme TaxID=2816119 RepID=A0ABS5CRG4_9FLAO|nr:hypothetical protein [Flavobacterium flabelliforme]MBP4141208.1 hypothetical protein [Flavobacterium flabelliforme]